MGEEIVTLVPPTHQVSVDYLSSVVFVCGAHSPLWLASGPTESPLDPLKGQVKWDAS